MIQPAPGILLIADPFLKDPNFIRTVVFLCEHQDEGKQVEDLSDGVREQECRPVEVIGHVADFCQSEEGEPPAQQARSGAERTPREIRAEQEDDDVDGQESDGRNPVDEVTDWHASAPFSAVEGGPELSGHRRSRCPPE